MFDLDRFVEDCRAGLRDSEAHIGVREILARTLDDPAGILTALGEPSQGGVEFLYHASDMTILNVVWPPFMTIMPHNHNMWAVIGVYGGREDNIFWRRIADDPEGRIEAAGAKSIGIGDLAPLGHNIIHSVTNPTARFTAGIHVYGGDFIAAHKSEWEPETLVESPYSLDKSRRLFAEANARALSAR